MSKKVSFPVFFMIWAQLQGWDVPYIHVQAVQWLERRGELAVLRCFRGFGKSTILAVYNAWRYYRDPTWRILHQGDKDPTAYKTSRDTKRVLMRHPLTKHLTNIQGEVSFWWVPGADDPRNPSMQAAGILSNITSSRADEIQNDDVEVPKNIRTAEARELLRYRLGEQTHILAPGGYKLFVGTPHTHDSLYDEMERLGADCLTIPMFGCEHRIPDGRKRNAIPFVPEYVFMGIGAGTKLLEPGTDYQYKDGYLLFDKAPHRLVDCYAQCAWPARFNRDELLKRRRQTRTVNEWDSQYQLHSKPVTEVRLDPDSIIPYDCEPVIRMANGQLGMWLGETRIVGASAYWDCSLGKVKSDASAFCVVFTDDRGQLYWHIAQALTGELAEFGDKDVIIGGQVMQIRQIVERYQLPRVVVETNGPGGFVPNILRQALRGTGCGVGEEYSVIKKQQRILDAFEPPLSSRFLWAHIDVLNGPVWDQMRDFNPAVTNQPDDYLDSAAGAITQTPIRIGRLIGNSPGKLRDNWQPIAGVHEVTVDY